MAEDKSEGWMSGNSASSLFNKLVEGEVKKTTQPKTTVVGVNSAEEQIAVENWLSDPKTQNFIERHNKGEHKTLGLVTGLEHHGDDVYVNYVDQDGMSMGFVYEKGDPNFEEAPDGFQEGDLILNDFEHHLKMKSVKPVSYPPKTEKKIIRKFMQILGRK